MVDSVDVDLELAQAPAAAREKRQIEIAPSEAETNVAKTGKYEQLFLNKLDFAEYLTPTNMTIMKIMELWIIKMS